VLAEAAADVGSRIEAEEQAVSDANTEPGTPGKVQSMARTGT